MGTIDFITLLKFKIFKNSGIVICLLTWFVVIPPLLLLVLGNGFGDGSFWIIPFNTVALLIWIFDFIVLKELIEYFIDYKKRAKHYTFTETSWNKEWMYNGKSKIISNEGEPILQVTSSRAGCLLEKYLWKDFEMKFDMRFMLGKTEYIGIVFRAEDLENYFMVQIRKTGNKIEIVPHVRYLGMWEVMSAETLGLYNQVEWLKVSLIVKGTTATIAIATVGSYVWHLPTHVDINHISFGVVKNKNINASSQENFSAKVTSVPKIQFRNIFGKIGFRVHQDEGAEIKNLIIKKWER